MRARSSSFRIAFAPTALGVFFLVCVVAGAVETLPGPSIPSLGALKVSEPIRIDGILDEAFWARAAVGTGFIDTRTHQPAAQQTTVRVAYTDSEFYIAVECFDEAIEQIRASERREDRSFVGDDWVEIHFDPSHTHRGKYAFFSNPLGTKADANEGPSGVFNYGWTAEWDLAAQILSNRWVFEMRIPFSVMNYRRKDGSTWGFNVTRCLRRTDTISFWSFNVNEMYKPRNFGHLTGLNLAESKFDRNWEVVPYVSAQTDFNHDTDTFIRAGGDVSFRLSPSVTTAWTVNPDFGQVEADADTIELRDTERFLPEKRLYFREGEELLRLPYRLYYSRRFTDIMAGARLSGQLDGFSFALLDIYGDTTHDGIREGNSTVLRVLQDVGQKSSLGYYVNDSEFTDGHSRVVGADGYFFITDAWRYRFQGAVADSRQYGSDERSVTNSLDWLGLSSIIYDLYPWSAGLNYHALTEDFNPTLAYIPRRDIFGPSFWGSFFRQTDNAWYKVARLSYECEYYDNSESDVSVRDHGVFGNVVFPNDFGVEAAYGADYHAPYHNQRTSAGIEFFASDYWRSLELGWAGGVFEETYYNEVRLEKPFKIIERMPIQYDFTIRFEDRADRDYETVWLNRFIFDLYLTDKMWVKASLQHRNNGVHNLSLIYGWEVFPRTHWYVVFNDVQPEDEDQARSIFTKVTYSF